MNKEEIDFTPLSSGVEIEEDKGGPVSAVRLKERENPEQYEGCGFEIPIKGDSQDDPCDLMPTAAQTTTTELDLQNLFDANK